MRAAIYHGSGQPLTIETVPDPIPAADELLVEIGRCGVCGSDVAMTSGGPFDYPTGQCFGHEFAGTVVETRRDCGNWKVGDPVACMPKSGCGRCEICREGRLLFCPYGKGVGEGFAEYVAVPATAVIPLPKTLSLSDGALIEPIACGLRALHSAGMRGGERILVLGAGSMALAVVWWARRLGAASIVVASRSAHRRETCLAFGADAVHSFNEDDPAALEQALGGPPHIVAECVGKEGMINLALEHVRLGGTVISMGMCMRTEAILPAGLTFKEARLIFPLAYSVQEYENTARALEAEGFQPEIMVSDVLPLERLGETLESIRAGAQMMKVHIDPRMPHVR